MASVVRSSHLIARGIAAEAALSGGRRAWRRTLNALLLAGLAAISGCDGNGNDSGIDPGPAADAPAATPPAAGGGDTATPTADGGDSATPDDTTPDDTTPTGPTTTTTVGTGGGTVTSPDGSLTLTIPAGALPGDVDITITELEATETPAEFADFSVLRSFDLGPSGTLFDLPVSVELTGLGNPVLDAGVLSTPALFLATTRDGAIELLTDPEVEATAGAGAEISARGTITHFSPLVAFAAEQIEAELDGRAFRVDGLPATAQVGVRYPITISLSATTFNVRSASFCQESRDMLPAFASAEIGFCPDSPLGTDPEREIALTANADLTFFTTTLDFECSEEGVNEFTAFLFATLAENQPDSAFRREAFAQSRATFASFPPSTEYFASGQLIDCQLDSVDPPEELPIADILAGVTSVPGSLQAPEAIRFARFTAPEFFFTPASVPQPASSLPFAYIGGDTGSVGVNLVDGSLLFDNTSPTAAPLFGVELLARPQSDGDPAAALLQFGPGTFGGFLLAFDPDSQQFGPGGSTSQGRHTDATPSCPTPPICDELVVSRETGVSFVTYDPIFGSFGFSPDSLAFDRYGSQSPLSAFALEPGGPLLVVTASSLWFDDRAGVMATEVAALGGSPRKIRCSAASELCVISQFDNDALLPVRWDGMQMPTVGTPVAVGDGPVGIDLLVDPVAGTTLVVSTGFNDDTFTVTTFDADGTAIGSVVQPPAEGCTAPAHAVFVPNANADGETAVLGTCFGSDAYIIYYFL